MWAQVSVVCEERETQVLERARGGFWGSSSSSFFGEDGEEEMGEGDAEEGMKTQGAADEAEEEEWEREVTAALESLGRVAVEDGCVLAFVLSSCCRVVCRAHTHTLSVSLPLCARQAPGE